MLKKIMLTGALAGMFVLPAQAQQQQLNVPLPEIELPFLNPIELQGSQSWSPASVQSDPLNRELLQRVTDINRLNFMAMEAQVDDDLLLAEDYITQAVEALQSLMNEHPEVQNNRRFNETFRSVMAEYHEFYGMSGPVISFEGDIFEIRDDFFSQDDWFDGSYFAMPPGFDEQNFDVPLIINTQVNNQIHFLTERRPEIMERWLERSTYYFPMMKRIFEEEGVPIELIHLSMIESGLVPVARSRARAVGLWQFMQATGAAYGLEVNWWIDERRDPEKSTRAAARHLRDLHRTWNGDWHMALAGYNISPRGLRRAINLSGGVRDFWTIYPHLPRETRGYVPGFIAAALVAMNHEDFGFETPVTTRVYEYDVVEIEGSVELRVLAQFAGISTQELRNLNPELLRFATPPGARPYPLKIPKGSRDTFLAEYRQMPESMRQTLVVHTVRRGETLGAIANRYGVTVRALYGANDNLTSLIHPGQEVIIPVPGGSNVAISPNTPSNAREARTLTASAGSASSQASAPAPAGTVRLSYTVRSGDTVGHIAEWYNTQAWRVRSWNNIGNTIRVGQRLNVYVPANQQEYFSQVTQMSRQQKNQMMAERRRSGIPQNQIAAASGQTITYTVRRNDNLHNIARAHGTTVNAIMQQNNLRNSVIRPGQTLQIPVAR
ncbi:membrane-bound lytic murein transglycosylase D [Cyclonatronum proteinivorum]|uniref:Membrane-bound lytic murein transglycosylase D n=1 Tax=Cyclonatronum proteinivorum TaxID=1457365 RepID=A0A345UMT2_9BACT|nr:lytic transglycosylase domain-containing protein [Cyclonatronum proteinivorum]AXJ01784.1 membrane-bound lytic murein transglycosylase D [Cyclonatronum proteinivorum]